MKITDRFLKYVALDTSSDPSSETFPSTARQLRLLGLLLEELLILGLEDAQIDEYGYVTATLKSNSEKQVQTVAFIAHVDTSPEVSGKNVKAQIVDYKGGDIILNDELKISENQLVNYVGDRLITTDGSTLLGADDKAGVAAIMTAIEFLIAHPEIEHGDVKVLFTPDEEVGRGVDFFSVEGFGADFAYTVDGGELGSLEWETFNAAEVKVSFKGENFHPGYAKNKMINAQTQAMKFHAKLPFDECPEKTELRDGFYHLIASSGSVESAELQYIIRDHDRAKFDDRKALMLSISEQIEGSSITITDQYYNMGEVIKDNFQIVDLAVEAMKSLSIEPKISAIRGGTDGARLSFMGLPCPNLFTGAENIHSRKEFASERVMDLSSKTIVNIVKLLLAK